MAKKEPTKEIAKKEEVSLPAIEAGKANDIFFDSALFAQAQRAADLLSKSTMIPDQYRNKMPDCFIALASANRLSVDVFAYMQSSYVVHGRPGLEAKLVIALVNTRGPFDGPIQWKMEGEGNTRKCTAYARHTKTKELCEFTLTWEMVVAEGWNKKKGTMESKWNTLPDLMFRYRSATFLARLYCPEVIQGITTVEELNDIQMAVTSDGTYAIESEIKENANQTPVDIDTETGEVADAECAEDSTPQPPPEKSEPQKDTPAPTEDKESPEPQEEPEFEETESPIDTALRTGKEEKEQKQKQIRTKPKYVERLCDYLNKIQPSMLEGAMDRLKEESFGELCEKDQAKIIEYCDKLIIQRDEAAGQQAGPEREF